MLMERTRYRQSRKSKGTSFSVALEVLEENIGWVSWCLWLGLDTGQLAEIFTASSLHHISILLELTQYTIKGDSA